MFVCVVVIYLGLNFIVVCLFGVFEWWFLGYLCVLKLFGVLVVVI